MGRLVDGKWRKTSIITSDESGSYKRIPRSFRDSISKDHPTLNRKQTAIICMSVMPVLGPIGL